MHDVLWRKKSSFRANFALSTFCWADLNKKLGPTFCWASSQQKVKSWAGGRMARSSGKGWMAKWSISMQISLRLIHLSILKYLVLSKLRIPKIWSRFADLINCASLRQYISRHIFSQSEPFDVVFFFILSPLKFLLIRYIESNILKIWRPWIQRSSPSPGSVYIVRPSQHPGKKT